MPTTLTELQPFCFLDCSSLKRLDLGKNINNLRGTVFSSSSIQTVTIDEENPNFSINNGALYSKDGTVFISHLKKSDTITTYSVPEGVKEIAGYAFSDQRKMTSIILPSTLEKIGDHSFSACTSLPRIEIPSSVISINVNCFVDCGVNLKEIIIHKPKNSISGSPWGSQYGDRGVKWEP